MHLSFQERELEPGDIIAVKRKLLYQHFAVYIGEGKVIHFASSNGELKERAKIHEAPFESFLRDSNHFEVLLFEERRKIPKRQNGKAPKITAMAKIMNSSKLLPSVSWLNLGFLLQELERNQEYHLYSPQETVERAKNVAREQKYNLLFNNCEHFAIWCKTGIHESRQIDNILRIVSNLSLS